MDPSPTITQLLEKLFWMVLVPTMAQGQATIFESQASHVTGPKGSQSHSWPPTMMNWSTSKAAPHLNHSE